LEPVALRVENRVAKIEFGDPAKQNLLTVPLLDAMAQALGAAVAAEARVVVVRGRGSVWSAGYDIAQIPAALFDARAAAVEEHPFERCMRAVRDCPLPTIAAVNGHAVGGALELALSCDLRLACAGSRLGITAARLGLVYPHAGLETLWRLVGPAQARWLLFTGDLLSADEAARIGLVDRVVARPAFDDQVADLAQRIASGAPQAVQGAKEIFRRLERRVALSDADVRAILELRQRSYASDDFREGRDAFAAKRPPRFRGR